MSSALKKHLSAQQMAWYFFCALFPLSALTNGSIPFLEEEGVYAFGGQISIRIAAFLIPLCVAGILWGYSVFREQAKVRRNPLHVVLLVLALLMVLATLFAPEKTVAVFGSRSVGQGLLVYLGYFLCAFLASQMVGSMRRAQELMWVIVGTGTVVAFLALCEVAGISITALTTHDWMHARGIATLGTSDHLGTFLVFPAVCACGLVVLSRGWQLVASALCSLVLVYALFFTMTRGAWVGLLAGVMLLSVLILFVLKRRDELSVHSVRVRKLMGIGVMLAVVVLSFFTVFSGSEFSTRIEHAVTDFQTEGQALAGRAEIWGISLEVIRNAPLFGVGADNVLYAAAKLPGMVAFEKEVGTVAIDSAHNMYLDWTLNFGLLFAVGMVVLVAALLVQGARRPFRLLLRSQSQASQSFQKDKVLDQSILLMAWVAGFFALSVAFLTAVTNPAIMALYFAAAGFLFKYFDTEKFYEGSIRGLCVGFICVLAAGLLVYGMLEGTSALVGNASRVSAKRALQQSEAALKIAPWRKEPLGIMLQVVGSLSNSGNMSDADAMDVLRFIAERDPLGFEVYISMASIAFYNQGNPDEARGYVEKALILRPTLAVASDILTDIEAAQE